MAKSLFASLPRQIPNKAVLIQPQNDGFLTEEGNNIQKLGNSQGYIHEFHKAFNTQNHHQINIGLQLFKGGCESVELDNCSLRRTDASYTTSCVFHEILVRYVIGRVIGVLIILNLMFQLLSSLMFHPLMIWFQKG